MEGWKILIPVISPKYVVKTALIYSKNWIKKLELFYNICVIYPMRNDGRGKKTKK